MNYSFTSLSVIILFTAAFFTFLPACLIAIKERRSLAGLSFLLCLVTLSMTQLFSGLSIQAGNPEDTLFWAQLHIFTTSVQPVIFLVFSLVFAQTVYKGNLARWKYILAAAFVLPVSTVVFLGHKFFEFNPEYGSLGQTIFPVGYAGILFYALILISDVLILANLEQTFRSSTGRIRWQIKFIVLGMSGICGVQIFSSSQVLIYSALDTSIFILHAAALIFANIMFLWGLIRSQYLRVEVYLSRTTIQYSLTTLLVSVYLVSIGILAWFIRSSDIQWSFTYAALLVFFTLTGLTILLLSARMQERFKRFVIRHFKRPSYDYRKSWMDLTEKTNSLVEVHDLCTAVSRIVSQTLSILSVNIWLCNEPKDGLVLAGSTVFTRAQALELERSGQKVLDLIQAVERQVSPFDLEKNMLEWANEIMQAKPEYFSDFKMKYILPLQTGGELVGILTLNSDRVGYAPLSLEDQDLLNAYTSHLAARVLQLRLSDNLRKIHEVESYQNVSAFFVHDLKNLASRLSLTMQNLPAYFDNPKFRDDVLKLISESAAKIDATIHRLSTFKKVEINPVQIDLTSFLESILDDFERTTQYRMERDLNQLPSILIDPEHMQSVITNLVMNAYDATGDNRNIKISTAQNGSNVIVTVTDNGCGMSRQYLENKLFQPFSSTKKRGMGIGLFQSKMITEAHHGRIEVDSKEGKGTTFKVVLPI